MSTDPSERSAGPRGALVAALGLLACALMGCPGSLDDEAPFRARVDGGDAAAASCTDAPSVVFASRCVKCHSKEGAPSASGLDLASPDLVSRTLGVSARGGPGLLVDPASPERSVIYAKVRSSPPFGARMPRGEAELAADEIGCVLGWIRREVGAAAARDAGPEAGMDAGP